MAARRVNERRSRYNARRRILSEWHSCHGDVPTSYLLSDFIAYPEFLVLRDAPRDAPRHQTRLSPIYCDSDIVVIVVIVVECWMSDMYNMTRCVITEINSDEIESEMTARRCEAIFIIQ